MAEDHKKIAEDATLHEERRTVTFRITRKADKKRLRDVVYQSRHLLNMMLLMRKEMLDRKDAACASLLLNAGVVRALVAGSPGGKSADKVLALRSGLQNLSIFPEFMKCAANLKEKNIHALLKTKLSPAFKSYWTKVKKGDQSAREPKTKKLARLVHFSIPVDQCAFSLKRKNLIRINFGKKMESFSLSHEAIICACASLDALTGLEVGIDHDDVILRLIYKVQAAVIPEKPICCAGIDLGLKNIASLFIHDTSSPSLIIQGAKLIKTNAVFNRRVAAKKSRLAIIQNQLAMAPKDHAGNRSLEEKATKLQAEISRAFRRRTTYFADVFHKLSNRILEYCQGAGVSDLYVSRNLGFLKQAANKGSKKLNQKFCEIPMIMLVNHLTYKGAKYGIRVFDHVDEAYSSKVSCLSGDVRRVQETARKNKEMEVVSEEERKILRRALSNAFGGRRDRRDRYVDAGSGKAILADLNAAANHIKIGAELSLEGLKDRIWKLANPIVVSCDSMFLDLRFCRFPNKEERPESWRKRGFFATWSFV